MTRTGDFMISTPRLSEGIPRTPESTCLQTGSKGIPACAGTTKPVFRPGLLELGEKRLQPLQPVGQLGRFTSIRNPDRGRLAERRTGHAGDAFGVEQRVAEIDIVGDRVRAVHLAERDGDIRERIKRALRARTAHAGYRRE